MNDKIQVVVVDDHPLFRDGVVRTLGAETDIEVAGQALTAAEAVGLAEKLLPDVILLDITIPGGGLKAAEQISACAPVTKIIMLTASDAEDDVLTALKYGARGYLLKGVSGQDLIRAVRAVSAGETYITPSLAASLLSEVRNREKSQIPSVLDDLSERESQVLEQVATGASNKEIAAQLFLSEKTVKHYMTNILQKLQVRNRVEAALLVQKNSAEK
jgi:DNA-binding NarL/FixJ family response regulator